MSLTPIEVGRYCQQAQFSGSSIVMAIAIAGAESNWNPAAIGDVALENATWGPSIGMWQVRTLKAETNTSQIRDVNWLSNNPLHQAQAAYVISSGGTNWTPWSTYTNGAYKRYFQQAIDAYNSLEGTVTKIIAFAPAPDGQGYWIVFEDGAVFAFGSAGYHGRPLWDGTKWTVAN